MWVSKVGIGGLRFEKKKRPCDDIIAISSSKSAGLGYPQKFCKPRCFSRGILGAGGLSKMGNVLFYDFLIRLIR